MLALPGVYWVYKPPESMFYFLSAALDSPLITVSLREHFDPHIAKAGVKVYEGEKFSVSNEIMGNGMPTANPGHAFLTPQKPMEFMFVSLNKPLPSHLARFHPYIGTHEPPPELHRLEAHGP